MGPLVGSYREEDKENYSMPRTPYSRRTRSSDDGLMAFDSCSEFSFDDSLTDEGRLSRSIPVKTTETVQTWSTATAAIVFMDLMEQTVKMVSIAIVVFVSDPIVKKMQG